LSLLDRILSAAPEKQISHAMVVDRLGVPDRRIMHELTQALLDKDVPALIALVDRVNDTGMDLKKFYGDLIGHVRHMNIIRHCGPDHPAVNLTADEKQRIHALAATLPEAYPGQLLQVLLTDEDMVKRTSHPRIAIETVLFKLLQVREGASIDRIIQQLDLLARQVGSGGTGTGTDPGKDCPAPADGSAESVSAASVPFPAPAYSTAAAPDHRVTGVRETADPAPPQAPDIPRTWDGFLTRIETQMPSLHVLLSRGRITSETENALELHLSDCTDFDRKRLTAKQKELDRQCQKFLGRTLTIHIASDTRPPARNGAGPEDIKARQTAFQHPLVQHARDLFNGEIINF
jgi:DNA polymerase-3 subunit gamma/tau